jgi:hypothetical protein
VISSRACRLIASTTDGRLAHRSAPGPEVEAWVAPTSSGQGTSHSVHCADPCRSAAGALPQATAVSFCGTHRPEPWSRSAAVPQARPSLEALDHGVGEEAVPETWVLQRKRMCRNRQSAARRVGLAIRAARAGRPRPAEVPTAAVGLNGDGSDRSRTSQPLPNFVPWRASRY